MKFKSIKVTSFIKLGLFFHKISFIINTHFQTFVFLQRISCCVMNLETSITVPSNTTKCYSNKTGQSLDLSYVYQTGRSVSTQNVERREQVSMRQPK